MCFYTQDPTPCSAKEPRGKYCERCLIWLPVPGGDDLALDYGQCVKSFWCSEYEATGRMSCDAQ